MIGQTYAFPGNRAASMNVFSRGDGCFPVLPVAGEASYRCIEGRRHDAHSASGKPAYTQQASSTQSSFTLIVRTGISVRLTEITGRHPVIPVAPTIPGIHPDPPAGHYGKWPPSGQRTGWRPFLQLCHAGRHDTRGHAFTKLPCGVMRTRRSRSVRSSSTSKTYHSPDGVSA